MSMDPTLQLPVRRQVDRFCRQFLQLHLKLDYPDEEFLRNDTVQRSLYDRLFGQDAVTHKPPVWYQLRVLKELARRIELSIQDWEEEGISDDLMNSLTSLFTSPIPLDSTDVLQKSYVTYTLSRLANKTGQRTHIFHNSPLPTITLLENRTLISATGTTGLRTWEASLHLGSYLIDNPSIVQNRNILELGTGTGYISILCARYLDAAHVLATDGAPDVISALSSNFDLNSLQTSSKIEGKQLVWGHKLAGSEQKELYNGHRVDLVVGADVTYDDDGIRALVTTLVELFAVHQGMKVLIAAMVRNEMTFGKFLSICEKKGFEVEMILWELQGGCEQEGPFFEVMAPIKMVMITQRD